MQNKRSDFVSVVFNKQINTPSILNKSAPNINRIAIMPAFNAYCPKATVQAAIGSVPLAAGLGCGQIVLTIAVLSILITAPLGAFLIEHTYKKWLKKEQRAY